MKHLLTYWDQIERLLDAHRIVLALDYDGTLTPIVDTPDKAQLSVENKQLLESLTRHCTLAIVSGRALEDIRAKVNLKNIMYIGNHGLEINGPLLSFESLITPYEKDILDRLKNELIVAMSDFQGVWIEDKGVTLSVHYRLAQLTDEVMIHKVFYKTCRRYTADQKIRVTEGKKVLEVRPFIDWDKGKALLWLLTKERNRHAGQKVVTIFIGDDKTDEDALSAIVGQGIGVVVGAHEHSKAEYFLKDTDEVTNALKRIVLFFASHSTVKG